MTNLWRPERSQLDSHGRAILSMVPGSLQGQIAQASPVRQRVIFGDAIDAAEDEWLAIGGKRDTFAIETPGDQELLLSFTPMEDTEHVRWHPGGGAGVLQDRSQYDIVGSLVTLHDPNGVMQAATDHITVQYLHTFNAQPPEPVELTSVPLGGTWRYKEYPGVDNATSFSHAQPGYDDSAWPEGTTPFNGGVNDSVWTRRWVTMHGNTKLRIYADYVDDRSNVFLNGAHIWSPSWSGAREYFTAELPAGEHLVAANVWNVGTGGMQSRFELYEVPLS